MQRRKEKLARKAARFASDALDVGDGNLGIVGEGDKSKEEKAKKWRGGGTPGQGESSSVYENYGDDGDDDDEPPEQLSAEELERQRQQEEDKKKAEEEEREIAELAAVSLPLSMTFKGEEVVVQTMFIEVKSANDTLDSRQVDWLNIMASHHVLSRVCKFKAKAKVKEKEKVKKGKVETTTAKSSRKKPLVKKKIVAKKVSKWSASSCDKRTKSKTKKNTMKYIDDSSSVEEEKFNL